MTFWSGPAAHGPVNVTRRPSQRTAFSPSWSHTMSGSASVTCGEIVTWARR